jgi:hypothetical protein
MMNSGAIPAELSHSGLIPAESGNSGPIPADSEWNLWGTKKYSCSCHA